MDARFYALGSILHSISTKSFSDIVIWGRSYEAFRGLDSIFHLHISHLLHFMLPHFLLPLTANNKQPD